MLSIIKFVVKMRLVLLAILSLGAIASAAVEIQSLVGYHENVAIPMATKIKAAEDAHFASQSLFSRIVGGVFSRPHAHPSLGGLLINYVDNPGTGVCGSSLISSKRLVTAAHCWFDGRVQASRFVVVLGSNHLFSGGDRIATSTVATHPGWDPITSQNDIAVIYLQNAVHFARNIQPIALPTDLTENFDGEWVTAVGFGKIRDEQIGIPVSSVVSEVNLQVLSVEQCQAVFGELVQDSNVCTDGTGEVGICDGDSGGPLFIDRDGQRVLIGISSFVAAAGCERGFPSGFTRVSSYNEFINEHL